MARPMPFSRDDFDLFRNLQTRWSDNDAYGHVNNVVHYLLFDSAVNGWLVERGLLDYHDGQTIGLVVDTACSYFSEIAFPDTVTAGIRVVHLGTSSVRYEIALFANDSDLAAAQGHFVHVYVDRASRRPVPLPTGWRAVLGEITT
jgi:acyl-CoA thioester hydrolase